MRTLARIVASLILTFVALPLPAQEVDPELLSAITARNVGPAGMSGRIAAIDALASDPNTIWVGAATGGVWKSTNAGTTWTPVFDDESVSGIGSIAIDPNAPDVVWVGTGEGNPRNSAGVGAGIYKTMDGGETWELLGLEESERIHRIIVHPHDSDVVWAGVMGPAWSDGEERGVYKTTDGGRTWRQVLWANERTGVSDLVMDPTNPMKLYAGMWEFRREPWFFTSGGPGSGLHVSHDGGETWKRYTEADGMPAGELGRIGLAIAPSEPDIVYALVEAGTSALLRSEDGGRSWQTVNTNRGVANRPFYYTDIFVDPENELRIYNLNSRVMISEDGGRTFQRMASDVHSDFHAMWLDPNDGAHLLLGTDGGVYESRDRARTWRFFDNIPVGQFYHISVDNEIPFNIYGGMQDNGSWRGPSDLWEVDGIRNFHWEEVGFGDGFNTIEDPRDPNYGFAMSQGGNLQRYDRRNGERKNIRPWAPDSTRLRFNWNAAIALDPFNVGTIYYGSQFVHKSADRGHTWEIVSADLTTNDPEKQKQNESGGITRDATGAENHTTIVTIAPSPVQQDLVWAGSDDGKIHLTQAGGGTWVDLTDEIGGVPDDTWIPHIEASKHDAGTAYVVFEDHRRGNWDTYLYRTDDFGDGWDNIGKNTDIHGFLHVVEEDPVSPNLLFAGGEFGLWVSIDRGDEWFKWTHGFPTAPVRSLVVHPRDHDLVVGTHGRALWVLDDIRPLRALSLNPDLVQETVHLFEPPVAYVHTTAAVNGYHFSADAMFKGETRPRGALLTFWVGAGVETDSAEVTVNAEDGRTVRAYKVGVQVGMNRFAWNLREDAPGVTTPQGGGGGGFGRGSRAPEVLPGTYTVTIAVDGTTTSRPLVVMPDPRVDVSMAERQEKYDAVLRSLELNRRLTDVQRAAQEVRDGLDRVAALLEGEDDDAFEELREAARELRSGLADAGSTDEVNQYRRSVSGLAGSYDRPTEGQLLDLGRMEDAIERLEGDMNVFLVGDVARFRELVIAADLDAFPEPRMVGT